MGRFPDSEKDRQQYRVSDENANPLRRVRNHQEPPAAIQWNCHQYVGHLQNNTKLGNAHSDNTINVTSLALHNTYITLCNATAHETGRDIIIIIL